MLSLQSTMPRKKRSTLSRVTNRARNLFRSRQNETRDETEHRLHLSQERMAGVRANETDEARLHRIQTDQQRTVSARENETIEHRALRLQNTQQRNARARIDETIEHRALRLQNNQQRNASARIDETIEHRAIRLQNNQQRNARARNDETLQHRVTRQQSDLRGQQFRHTLGPVRTRDEEGNKLKEEIKTPFAAFRYDKNIQYNRLSYIGKMDVKCDRCKAKKWNQTQCVVQKIKNGLGIHIFMNYRGPIRNYMKEILQKATIS